MRTILTMQDKNGSVHNFSFETSPILNQSNQINKIIERENLQEYKFLRFDYFDAHELKPANL